MSQRLGENGYALSRDSVGHAPGMGKATLYCQRKDRAETVELEGIIQPCQCPIGMGACHRELISGSRAASPACLSIYLSSGLLCSSALVPHLHTLPTISQPWTVDHGLHRTEQKRQWILWSRGYLFCCCCRMRICGGDKELVLWEDIIRLNAHELIIRSYCNVLVMLVTGVLKISWPIGD